jgi:hypothetical protein
MATAPPTTSKAAQSSQRELITATTVWTTERDGTGVGVAGAGSSGSPPLPDTGGWASGSDFRSFGSTIVGAGRKPSTVAVGPTVDGSGTDVGGSRLGTASTVGDATPPGAGVAGKGGVGVLSGEIGVLSGETWNIARAPPPPQKRSARVNISTAAGSSARVRRGMRFKLESNLLSCRVQRPIIAPGTARGQLPALARSSAYKCSTVTVLPRSRSLAISSSRYISRMGTPRTTSASCCGLMALPTMK